MKLPQEVAQARVLLRRAAVDDDDVQHHVHGGAVAVLADVEADGVLPDAVADHLDAAIRAVAAGGAISFSILTSNDIQKSLKVAKPTNIVVVTNAFLKKSREVPDAEIEKSRKAMADWISRRGWEDL